MYCSVVSPLALHLFFFVCFVLSALLLALNYLFRVFALLIASAPLHLFRYDYFSLHFRSTTFFLDADCFQNDYLFCSGFIFGLSH